MAVENEGNQDFDAELEAILNQGEEKDSTLQGEDKSTQQAAAEKLAFGGREFGSPSELGKAYESLLKDYSRKGNQEAEYKDFINWGKAVKQHPDLHKQVDEVIKNFNKNLADGMSRKQATKEANEDLSEFQKRVEFLEQREANRELEFEIAGLKNKYKLDPNDLRSVLEKATQFAEAGKDLPLEDVYRIIAFDRRTALAKTEGEKAGLTKAATKRAANVGGSDSAPVSATAKQPWEMSSSEYDAALEEALRGTGNAS